jgi:hypothetical protein
VFRPPVVAAGFVRLPIGDAVNAYRDFVRRVSWWRIVTRKEVHGTLLECLEHLHPLRQPYTKALFLETAADYTAFIVNDSLMSGCTEHMANIVRETRSFGVHVICEPEDPDGSVSYPMNELQIYEFRGADQDIMARSISVAREDSGRWLFGLYGQPFPFEDPEVYKALRIKDRFPTEVLDRYLQALGIRFFDDSFYLPSESSRAVLVRLCP